jgi:polar amino acid transport system substrate-binding protein
MSAQPRWSRRNLFRGGLVAGGLIAVPGLMTACSSTGGNTLDKIKNGDKVRVAFANEPPFGFEKGGKVIGEAPAIHRVVLKALGAKEDQIDFKLVTKWDSLIPGLGKNHDLVAAGMAIIPERCEAAIFSEPEYITGDSLVVLKGNPKGLKDLTSFLDNKDAKLGVMEATSELSDAEAIKVPEEQIEIRPDLTKLIQELKNGRIDAIALTTPTMNYAADADDEIEALESFITQIPGKAERKFGSAGGAVFDAKDTEFRDAFNEELAKITGDKEKWLSLVGEFGFTETEFPPKDVTTKSLCAANDE